MINKSKFKTNLINYQLLVIICFAALNFLNCTTTQNNIVRKPGEINIGSYQVKIPSGYQDVTDADIPQDVKYWANEFNIGKQKLAIYNKNNGTLIFFDLNEDLNDNMWLKLQEQIKDLNEINIPTFFKQYIPNNLKSLKFSNWYIVHSPNPIVSANFEYFLIEFAFFFGWHNIETNTKKDGFFVFGVCRLKNIDETRNIISTIIK